MILASLGIIAGKGIDADAQTFITAASITDTTQKNAVNTLVTDLKSANIWSKMKAIYPFVGGNANAHKFNLKDPRDLNAAYRLQFNGGWTHSNTGALPNGTNGYADTYYNAFSNIINTSAHLSVYNTTANAIGTSRIYMGAISTLNSFTALTWGSGGTKEVGTIGGLGADYSGNLSAFAGHKIINTNGSRSARYFKNGIFQQSVLQTSNIPNINIYIGAANEEDNILPPSPNFFQNVNLAFASIGDGLTDAEATAFYNAVQNFNTTLGRQVGVPIVADSDAQAFLNAAVITDTTQASAINTLVTDLKSANIWSKMKAIYPFVGGTATSHKFNLKDPRDLDAAYRLVFSGGWTHSSTGVLPNGSNAYADTKLNLNTTQPNNTSYLSYYSRTLQNANTGEIGGLDSSTSSANSFYLSYGGTLQGYNGFSKSVSIAGQSNQTQGYYALNAYNLQLKVFKNNTQIGTTTSLTSYNTVNYNLYIGAINNGGVTSYYSNKESAFASIGDGLTDSEAIALYNAVQNFNTTLGRQV